MSLEKYSTRRFDDRVMAAIEKLVELKKVAANLVSVAMDETESDDPEEEHPILIAAQALEATLNELTNEIQSVNNAAVTLTRNVSGANTEEEYEVDVLASENGVQF